jgi:hypothetical protein
MTQSASVPPQCGQILMMARLFARISERQRAGVRVLLALALAPALRCSPPSSH